MKTTHKIEVTKIEVIGDMFSFHYKIWDNDKLIYESDFMGSHAWGKEKKKFITALRAGHVAEIAIKDYLQNKQTTKFLKQLKEIRKNKKTNLT